MIYGGYFDESDEKPGFSVAGYLAAGDTWLHLGWEWDKLLKYWKSEYFKASECENLQGQFAKYRENPNDHTSPLNPNEFEKMKGIKTQFIDAICHHHDDLRGFGAAVVVEDFERIISEDAIAKKYLMGKPYFICAQICLMEAGMIVHEINKNRGGDIRIEIGPVFDSHEQYSGIARVMFDDFIKKNPISAGVLLPPAYRCDIDWVYLQVADTLAYEVRKLLVGRLRNPKNYHPRHSLIRLFPGIDRIFRLDYKSLRIIVDNQSPDSIPIDPVKSEELR